MAFLDSTVVNVALPALQKPRRNGRRCAVGCRILRIVPGSPDPGWWFAGRSAGSPIDVLGWCGDFYYRIQRLWIRLRYSAVDGRTECSRALGAAFLVPGSLAIIGASFDEKTRGQAIGTWSGFTAITMAVGPVLGGWLIEHASWRWAFFLNLPLAAAVIALSLWCIPESRGVGPERIDWWGSARGHCRAW